MRYEDEMPTTFASQDSWSWHEQMTRQSRGDEILARRERMLKERRERDALRANAFNAVEGSDQIVASQSHELPVLPQERRNSHAPFYPPLSAPTPEIHGQAAVTK